MVPRSAIATAALASILATPGHGQSLLGMVIDSVTQQPLHGAWVEILNSELNARTGADGTFEITGIESGEAIVTFQVPGYATAGMRLQLSVTDERDVSIGIITLSPAATVMGFVIDSASQLPLRDVEVSIPDLGITSVTDGQGEFILDGVPGGVHTFAFRRLGYLGAQFDAELTVVQPSEMSFGVVPLAPTALLEAIEVVGEQNQSMIMPDFAQLKRTGQGQYISAADIERINPRNTSEILRRINGFRMGGDDGIGFDAGQMQGRSGTCVTGYYVDGVRSTSQSIDIIQPRAIAGIEVYSGPATIPAQYQTAFAPTCGLIVLWTKDAANRARGN